MCEFKDFCEFDDKGDDCADPDFQNGCEQYNGFVKMDDDRFRREMTGRRDAGKIARKRFAEKMKEAMEKLPQYNFAEPIPELMDDCDLTLWVEKQRILQTIDNTLNDGGNQQ